jgi:predicted transcriptional regulator YheO
MVKACAQPLQVALERPRRPRAEDRAPAPQRKPLTPEEAAYRRRELVLLRQIAESIERLFTPFCEVIVHDFTDLEHSIIHMEGALSGRSIGGAATDLLLERVRSGETRSDLHNYRTDLPNGRRLKSSTVFLRDGQGRAYGAFCVNYDATTLVDFQRVLAEMTRTELGDAVVETLSDDINATVRRAIAESVAELCVDTLSLTREDRVNLIACLDRKGVFGVKRAASVLAEQFGFSRASIYNYLREARRQSEDDGDKS